MPLQNNSPITVTGLVRILFRRRRAAVITFLVSLLAGLALAWLKPLSYESQAILERKPAKISPQLSPREGEEFDVYRLTSESQRSVALLKSRYLLTQWFDALGLPSTSPEDKEHEMNRLRSTLSVQPVSYTDLLTIKVRAPSPEKAQARNQTLIQLFSNWDVDQDRHEAGQLVTLLQQRMQRLSQEINQARNRLQAQKAALSLSLIGSAATRQLDAEISAKVNLQDNLLSELESAERSVRNDVDPRTRVLAPPTRPGSPVHSRGLMCALAVLLSVMLSVGWTAILEWLDPTVRRMQEIARRAPQIPVIVVPELPKGALMNGSAGYLNPLIGAVSEAATRKRPVIVQIASGADGDGKTTFSAALARALSAAFTVCVVHRSSTMEKENPTFTLGTRTLAYVSTLPTELIEPQLSALRERYDVIILDTNALPQSAPGSWLLRQADITCWLISAGRTSRFMINTLVHNLSSAPEQRTFFVLNRFKDPLPAWFQSC